MLNKSESLQHYKLQVALEGGMGFELITSCDMKSFKIEVQEALEQGRLAEITNANPDLASLVFKPKALIGFQLTPVSRLVATGAMPGPRGT